MPNINGIAVTQSQKDVYDILAEHGPLIDAALVPLAQHQFQAHQSSSGIRTRRSELERKGLVRPLLDQSVKMPSGRHSSLFEVV